MFQATEIHRSVDTDSKAPGFKWPRTQIEVLAKIADLGNFTNDIEAWLHSAVNALEEAPWFHGETAIEFVETEIFFLENFVLPAIDEKLLPIEIVDDFVRPVHIPHYLSGRAEEKLSYLNELRNEIQNIGVKEPQSAKLSAFLEKIRPALAKTNPSLARETTPVPLTVGLSQQLSN